MRSRTAILPGLLALCGIAALAAFLVLRSRNDDGTSTAPSGAALVESTLIEAGLPSQLAAMFAAGSTSVETPGAGRVLIVQYVPELKLRREVRGAILTDRRLETTGLRSIQTGSGSTIYPLHHSIRPVRGGYERYLAVFIPYENIDPAALQQLGVQRRTSTLSTHPIVLGATTQSPSAVLGVIIASVTTTNNGGFDDTVPGQRNPGLDNTALQSAPPQAPVEGAPAEVPQGLVEPPPLTPEQQAYLDAVNRELDAADNRIAENPLSEADYASMRRTNQILMEQGRHPDAEVARRAQVAEEMEARQAAAQAQAAEARAQAAAAACGGGSQSAASNVIPHLLQALGAASVVLEARSQFQSTRSDLDSGTQQINAYEASARGNSGDPIADALAQGAQTSDPLGTQHTAERASEARGDLAVNTGARVANTALTSAATLLGGPVGGAIAGVLGAIGDAMLRDVHSTNLADLDPSSGALSQRAQDVIHNRQAPAITNSLGPAPGENVQARVDGGGCEPINGEPGRGQALIVVKMSEDDGRQITFRSMVTLTPVVSGSDSPEFRGNATGPYREAFTSDQCGFTVSWTGQVTINLVARLETKAFEAAIEGPVTQNGEYPGQSCLGGYYYAPHEPHPAKLGASCRWDNIDDFTRPRIYESVAPEEGCTLNFGGGLVRR